MSRAAILAIPAYSSEPKELLPVVAEGVRVVVPGPGERVADLDRPLLERRVAEVVERDDEEDDRNATPGARSRYGVSQRWRWRKVMPGRRRRLHADHGLPLVVLDVLDASG